MARPFRVCVPRRDEKSGKTYWTKIGAAFPRQNGGMSIALDALPIGREVMIFPQDDREDSRSQKKDDDDVPY